MRIEVGSFTLNEEKLVISVVTSIHEIINFEQQSKGP
jgi:hypothetical protein